MSEQISELEHDKRLKRQAKLTADQTLDEIWKALLFRSDLPEVREVIRTYGDQRAAEAQARVEELEGELRESERIIVRGRNGDWDD